MVVPWWCSPASARELGGATRLGLGDILRRRYATRVQSVENLLETYGFWGVAWGSFFPLLPTDLVAYLAGVFRMSFRSFVMAVTLGELPLIVFLVALLQGLR